MRHWIKDTVVNKPSAEATYGGAFFAAGWVLFHFLRTMGWKWLWEDDSYYYTTYGLSDSSHCPDSNMEAAGTSDWTPDPGIAVAKDTTYRHMLTQSLKITNSLNGTTGSVDSGYFVSMVETVIMRCAIRYRNPTSNTYTVSINGSSPVDLSPTAGDWDEVHFYFVSSGTADQLSITCPDVSGVAESIWVDSINVFKGWYEYSYTDQDLSDTPDGQILNGNEFHSDSHNFISGDIGRLLCVCDMTNEGNSGVWAVTGLNGNDAVLNRRDGGTKTLADATGLRWRLIDTENAPYYSAGSSILAGYGLESPHTSKWRFFCKPDWADGPVNGLCCWMSPVDADFDVQTGWIDKSYPCTYDVYDYQYATQAIAPPVLGGNWAYRDGTYQRLYVVTDDDGTYLQILFRDVNDYTAYGIAGVMGADAVLSEEESFVELFPIANGMGYENIWWGKDAYGFHDRGAQATLHEYMVEAGLQMLGANDNFSEKEYGSYGQANPFSGNEWLEIPVVIRDHLNDNAEFAQSDVGNFGVRHCRVNYPEYSLVSDDLFHIISGWCMPWPAGFTPL